MNAATPSELVGVYTASAQNFREEVSEVYKGPERLFVLATHSRKMYLSKNLFSGFNICISQLHVIFDSQSFKANDILRIIVE